MDQRNRTIWLRQQGRAGLLLVFSHNCSTCSIILLALPYCIHAAIFLSIFSSSYDNFHLYLSIRWQQRTTGQSWEFLSLLWVQIIAKIVKVCLAFLLFLSLPPSFSLLLSTLPASIQPSSSVSCPLSLHYRHPSQNPNFIGTCNFFQLQVNDQRKTTSSSDGMRRSVQTSNLLQVKQV